MILTETQKEMYDKCVFLDEELLFLNESFKNNEHYEINDFDEEKLNKKIKNAIDKLKRSNPSIKGTTRYKVFNDEYRAAHQIYFMGLLRSINWWKEIEKSNKVKINYNEFQEYYFCKKVKNNNIIYAIILIYLIPYNGGSYSHNGKKLNWKWNIRTKKIVVSKSDLKSN